MMQWSFSGSDVLTRPACFATRRTNGLTAWPTKTFLRLFFLLTSVQSIGALLGVSGMLVAHAMSVSVPALGERGDKSSEVPHRLRINQPAGGDRVTYKRAFLGYVVKLDRCEVTIDPRAEIALVDAVELRQK